jgi:co-chaperonin GroES (HSP10)
MKYKAIGNRVLVELEKQADNVGGIFVPDRVIKNSNIGTVIELGTGKFDKHGKLIPWIVSIGDKIIVEPTMDMITILYDDKECAIFRQEEIVGVIK